MEYLFQYSFEDFYGNVGIYTQMVTLLKSYGYNVKCNCGKAEKEYNINLFINNKENIRIKMENIKKRTIKVLRGGVVYSTKTFKHYNLQNLSDEEIINLTERGVLSKDYFDLSDYKPEKEVEKVKVVDKAVQVTFTEVNEPINDEIVEEDETAETIVRDHFDMPNGELAKLLNEKGYKTKTGKNYTALVVSNIKKTI